MAESTVFDLKVESVWKTFGAFTAVRDFSIEVKHGEFLSLLGPSGCGKTTLLRIIAGLIEPDSGRVLIGGEDVTWKPVHQRNVGLVFQSYALFPHMSVFENIAFGPRRRDMSEKKIRERVEEMLAMVRLKGLGGRYPSELSGGQQQRVALARALVTEPSILLLDEPLSNLDAQLRDEMRVELKRLEEKLQITTIFVTHDQTEALMLSDRICVVNQGQVVQVDDPQTVYHQPANAFVANFLGRSNSFAGIVVATSRQGVRVRLDNGWEIAAGPAPKFPEGSTVRVTLRQEVIALRPHGSVSGENSFEAIIVFKAFAGAVHQYVVKLKQGIELLVESRSYRREEAFERGESVTVEFAPENVILVSPDQPTET